MGHCRFKPAWVWGGALIAIMACFVTPAAAISFHFSPANINIQARPGQIVNQTFTLTLAKDSPRSNFKAHIEDWWRSADNKQTFFAAPGTIKKSCGLWCTINPVEAGLNPGETMTVKMSIRAPDDAKPGGYWAALTIDEVLDPLAPKPAGVGMIFRASLSVGIMVEIPETTKSARITAVNILDDRAIVTLCNEGNTPVRVSGTFEFFKPDSDQSVAKIQLSSEPLLPEPINTCEFSTALPNKDILPSGKYKVRVIIDAGLDYMMGVERELQITRPDDK